MDGSVMPGPHTAKCGGDSAAGSTTTGSATASSPTTVPSTVTHNVYGPAFVGVKDSRYKPSSMFVTRTTTSSPRFWSMWPSVPFSRAVTVTCGAAYPSYPASLLNASRVCTTSR